MNFTDFSHRLMQDHDLAWRLFLSCIVMCIIFLVNDVALASTGTTDVIGQTLCRLVQNLTGGIAKAIATLAIFAVGIGMFLGKLNWTIAAATAGAVGIIFSAGKLVGWLSGDATNATCPVS